MSDQSPSATLCTPDTLSALTESFEAFAHEPLSSELWHQFQQTVDALPPSDLKFFADLARVRREQFEKHGGFTQRFVLSKDVGPDGSLRELPRPIPVRDDTRTKLARLVRDNPQKFPGGIQELLNTERPLQQASSASYGNLIAATIRTELNSLLRCDRNKLLKCSATLLDLAEAYRHLQRISAAHPKVVETIDSGDTTAMIEFLSTLRRTPLTEPELTRFVQLAAEGWEGATDKDTIVRGRVLQTGLDKKSALLTTWVEPFAAEVIFRGLLTELQTAYKSVWSRTRRQFRRLRPPVPAATPTKTGGPTTAGSFSAPLKPFASQPKKADAPSTPTARAASVSDTGPVDLSNTEAFKIPIGVPEPPRLHACAITCTCRRRRRSFA
ncbi:MAG: hypothetical protein U0992_01720 [Planctomycetaceae bacterium]